VLLAVALAIQLRGVTGEPVRNLLSRPAWVQGVAYGGFAMAIYLTSPNSTRFIYFQF